MSYAVIILRMRIFSDFLVAARSGPAGHEYARNEIDANKVRTCAES